MKLANMLTLNGNIIGQKKTREYKIISAVKESRLHGRVVQVYRVCVVFVYCAVSNIMKMIVSREH